MQVLNYKNILNETPLIVAVSLGHFQCVKELLAAGANCDVRDEGMHTVAHLAARNGHSKILQLILHHYPHLMHGKTKINETPLHLAVINGHTDCVKLLLSKGSLTKTDIAQTGSSNVSTLMQDFNGTPVHYAAMVGQLDALRCLIEYDCKLANVINDAGWCPLQTAVQFNQRECVEYLLKHGGNLSNVSYVNGSSVSVCDTLCFTFSEPVALLEKIWDSCVETKEERSSHVLDGTVLFRFNVLHPSHNRTENLAVLRSVIKCPLPGLSSKILLHPLTQVFIDGEWQKLGKYFFLMSLALHLILGSSLFCLSVVLKNSQSMLDTTKFILLFIALVCLVPLYAKVSDRLLGWADGLHCD